MTINVTINGDGTYAYDPPTKEKGKGKGTITWKLATNGYHFASPGVTWGTPVPSTAPPPGEVFAPPDIKATKMTVEDDNPGSGTVDYPYTLTIVADDPKRAADATRDDSGMQAARLVANDPIIRNLPT